MDPKTTLDLAKQCLTDGELVVSLGVLFDYFNWRLHGGFDFRDDAKAMALEAEILLAIAKLEEQSE